MLKRRGDRTDPFEALFVAYTYENYIGASSNHRKSMNGETSRQIPQKLSAKIELILLLIIRLAAHVPYVVQV